MDFGFSDLKIVFNVYLRASCFSHALLQSPQVSLSDWLLVSLKLKRTAPAGSTTDDPVCLQLLTDSLLFTHCLPLKWTTGPDLLRSPINAGGIQNRGKKNN